MKFWSIQSPGSASSFPFHHTILLSITFTKTACARKRWRAGTEDIKSLALILMIVAAMLVENQEKNEPCAKRYFLFYLQKVQAKKMMAAALVAV